MLFHAPRLSGYDFGLIRTPGPGLGNLLFPVLRAAIGVERMGGTFVYPTFAQLKFGPLLRRERDKRIYHDVARRRSGTEWAQWLRAKAATPRIDEALATSAGDMSSGCIEYRGLRRYFHDLAPHDALCRGWFDANMAQTHSAMPCDLAMHIRLGDFVADPQGTGDANTRTPADWYRRAYDLARERLGLDAPRVTIFTDGDFDEVRALLNLPSMHFDDSLNAAVAMRNLAAAPLIITSRSTFSMWGAFLGNRPAIWDASFAVEDYFPWRDGLDIRL